MASKLTYKLPATAFASMWMRMMWIRETYPEKIPARLVLRMIRNARILQGDALDLIGRQNGYLEKYGKRDSEGNFVPVPNAPEGYFEYEESEEAETARKELEQIGMEELEYQLEPLEQSDFTFMERELKVILPEAVMAALEPIIIDSTP